MLNISQSGYLKNILEYDVPPLKYVKAFENIIYTSYSAIDRQGMNTTNNSLRAQKHAEFIQLVSILKGLCQNNCTFFKSYLFIYSNDSKFQAEETNYYVDEFMHFCVKQIFNYTFNFFDKKYQHNMKVDLRLKELGREYPSWNNCQMMELSFCMLDFLIPMVELCNEILQGMSLLNNRATLTIFSAFANFFST